MWANGEITAEVKPFTSVHSSYVSLILWHPTGHRFHLPEEKTDSVRKLKKWWEEQPSLHSAKLFLSYKNIDRPCYVP